MADVELKRAGGLAYREALPAERSDRSALFCLHGWPQSSYMWRHLLPALASEGRRAIAPDLPGFGDSPPNPPGTWERHVDTVERFRQALALDRVVLVVHDTGGAIGLRWACDNPGAASGLVITNTGFFPDYEWHEIALAMRTPGQGEALVDSLSRDGLAAIFASSSDHIDEEAVGEYWKAFSTAENRRGMLELYRSADLEALEPYQGKLADLGVPALILWGEEDEYLPDDYAARFAREIPGSRLVMLDSARHFLFEDDPERCAREVVAFLEEAGV